MPEIHILDKAVAELIAAGEVVERPASIVKELLENCIDAGAKNISVEISGGGIRLIRITDDGCGISRDDIPKAFMRHATSKVCKVDDLDSILTLGFRGEALASIAAMCRVELITKTSDEVEGTSYSIEGGECTGCAPIGCPTGTTLIIRDVFFNTPARMKFLKKDISEGNSIAQVVDKCALSHPEVAFKFIRDGQVKLKTSGNGDLLAVIFSIHGREFVEELLAVDYVYEKFSRVSGFISKPNHVKPSRTYQTFFINGRFVKTRTGGAALEEAYKNRIMSGKFPACFLNLELDAQGVDVNVHPAKIEVRFADEKPVFSSIYYAVKTTLQKLEAPLGVSANKNNQTNEFTLTQLINEPVQQRLAAEEYRNQYVKHETSRNNSMNTPISLAATNSSTLFARPISYRTTTLDISVDDDAPPQKFNMPTSFDKKTPLASAKIFSDDATIAQEKDTSYLEDLKNVECTNTPSQEKNDFRVIGELFGTYIVLEQDSELLLVDKHAAHERIIYEKLKSEISYGNRQVLLTAQSVSLSREEHTALAENTEQVEKLGFLIEDFGGNTILVREIPIELNETDIAFIMREIADKLKNFTQDLTPNVLDRLYYSIACRSAIKAHDKTDKLELFEIVRQLKENPSITHCPHGRPVLIKLSRREIEKMFGRLG